jgi:fructosamine-3-kinase
MPELEITSGGRLTAAGETLLHDILRSEVGPNKRVVRHELLNSHHDYAVVRVTLDNPGQEIVVKLAGPDAPLACPFDRTAAIHNLVRAQTSVSVPEVLAVDASYRHWPVRYIIRSHVPGVEWAAARDEMNPSQLEGAYRQIGQAAAELHSLKFPAFGELSADATVVDGAPLLEALTKRAYRRIADTNRAMMFADVLNDRAHLFEGTAQASLCHEDLHRHNIIFRQERGRWRLAAILDFDSAWVGHHESDLARLDLWRGMTSEVFWEAYKSVHAVDEVFQMRRPIYQLQWCLEYASASEEHRADTQRVLAELGLKT